MRNSAMERASLSNRKRDFDYLSAEAAVEVRQAQDREISAIADMATQMVPGVQIGERALRRHFDFDPASILVFAHRGKLLGGMAFLFLDGRGHDALISGEFSPSHPDFKFFATRNEQVAATYIWAIGASGRGIAGLGKAAAHLRQPRFVNADCFAQPSTAAGRDLMITTGFVQVPSAQPDLWRYQRPWNRQPTATRTSSSSVRSFEDARY
ncbi:hypothetical protein [Bradyrhizobium lablabi]|uniref:hypothetical protein n=1 Tax=Bradyrhizobium lablabi TaxID=722472 RepID=UPI002012C5E1|nr:hypothetical protein [Bradyrhizobium lablabi]